LLPVLERAANIEIVIEKLVGLQNCALAGGIANGSIGKDKNIAVPAGRLHRPDKTVGADTNKKLNEKITRLQTRAEIEPFVEQDFAQLGAVTI
jgi:hypothetical protein